MKQHLISSLFDVPMPLVSPDDDGSMFHIDQNFVNELGRLKKDSLDYSRDEYILAKSLSFLYRFINDRQLLIAAISFWLDNFKPPPGKPRTPFLRQLASTTTAYMHESCKWRAMKQAQGDIRKFARGRSELAERMKTFIPKEAIDWATEFVSTQNVRECLPELLLCKVHQYFSNVLGMTRLVLLQYLHHAIDNQFPNYDVSSLEAIDDTQLTRLLLELPDVDAFLTSELYRILTQTYMMTAVSCWMMLNHVKPISQLSLGNGLVKSFQDVIGDRDCSCEDCTFNRQEAEQAGYNEMEWMFSVAFPAVNRSRAWGEYAPLIQALGKLNANDRDEITHQMTRLNATLWNVSQELVEERRLKELALKDERKDRKTTDIELGKANARISQLLKQVDEMRKARSKHGTAAPVIPTHNTEELRSLRKSHDRLTIEFGKKAEELHRVSELLKSVLSAQSESSQQSNESRKARLTSADLKTIKGVIIGGHDNLTSKLRKELPECTFYSPDVRTIDEASVKNNQYILLIAGYCNHCLTNHALRMSRLYGIPCGYTDRTNVAMVIEDIASIFENITAQ